MSGVCLLTGQLQASKVFYYTYENKHPSIPVIYGTGVLESYEVMDEMLKLIDYWTYNRKICCDLKVVDMFEKRISKAQLLPLPLCGTQKEVSIHKL